MSFFKQFPKLPIDINRDGVVDISTDFWRYVDIIDSFADDSFAYKKVRVPNEVRPDQLSNQLYGTPEFYWTFFILNDFLKDGGINAWAKGDQELDTYIKDAHERFAVLVFPPVDDPNDAGQYNLIDGMPINNPDYKDQLYLLFDIDESQETYAAVKIVHWDQSRYQLWVDKTQMYEYTPEEPGGASEGPDLIVKTDSHFNTFFTLSGGYKEFHIRYLDNPEKIGYADSEFDSQYELGSDFDSDYTAVKQNAWQTALDDLGYSTSEEENTVYAYQIFTDAERAPYRYTGTISFEEDELTQAGQLTTVGDGTYLVITLPISTVGHRYYLKGKPEIVGPYNITKFYNEDNVEVSFLDGTGEALTFKINTSEWGADQGYFQVWYSRQLSKEVLSAYDALSVNGTYSEFTSYYDHLVEENDEAREVRVLRPDRVREFAREYKSLLNK